MKFNILITNSGRLDYLKQCLRYIKAANKENHDIVVYVLTDEMLELFDRHNMDVSTRRFEKENIFNKSKFLNEGLATMRKDFDYLIQLDCDIIIRPDLFDLLAGLTNDWNVLGGLKLSKESSTAIMLNDMDYEGIKQLQVEPSTVFENHNYRYPGNIAITKKCYELYLKILEQKELYDDRFKGWGSEDSVLSITSTKMTQYGIIKKDYLKDCWRHLWHERYDKQPNFDQAQYEKNVRYLNDKIIENECKLKRYFNGQ